MRIEEMNGGNAPLCRLRLTFGSLRASAKGEMPMVVALPWRKPEGSQGRVVHLDPGERLDVGAIETVARTVRAGATAVVACTSLADATAAFYRLAEVAGYPVAGGAR